MSKLSKLIKNPVLFVKDSWLIAKKPVAKKPVAKKPVAKKPVAKKPVAKKLELEQKMNIKMFGLDFRNTSVVVYFYGTLDSYYQLEQWIQAFEELNKIEKMVFIFRDEQVYAKFINKYYYQSVFLRTLNDLHEFYNKNDFKVILYINNGVKNFQSLMHTKSYHIHINHGESEKESMYSNQAKAYDYIFTVGQRGVDRYKENLLNFDENKFIKIGRPQLDYCEPISIANEEKKIILYAPTWEATHDSMNYSSVAKYGEFLIKSLLMMNKYIVIYKPHSAMGTKSIDIKQAHNNILKVLKDNENGFIFNDIDINKIFPIVDFAFFDNTSVMIDFLNYNKPGAYLKIKEDQALRYILQGLIEIDDTNFSRCLSILEQELSDDTKYLDRQNIKEYYLGKHKNGESTMMFINQIKELCNTRDDALASIMI